VADAQARGLGLVVGLNVLHGGTPTGTKMTPSQVVAWGSALLSSTYPCASSAGPTTSSTWAPAESWVRWATCAAWRRIGAPGAAGGRGPPAARRRRRRPRRSRRPSRPPSRPRSRRRPRPGCRSVPTACPPRSWRPSAARSAPCRPTTCSRRSGRPGRRARG
jgi:hypothetical protein